MELINKDLGTLFEQLGLPGDPASIDAFMADGAERAGEIAEQTMSEVRRIVGFIR